MRAACRLHGIHRSTFYRWKAQVERFGPEILRPRERRRPRMPNAIPLSSSSASSPSPSGIPATARRASPPSCARPKWGGLPSRPTASGACCAVTASRPARCARPGRRLRRASRACHATRSPSATSRSTAPVSSCRSTASDRPPRRHPGRRLAVHRDRRRQSLHLGRAARRRPATPRALRLRLAHRRRRASCATPAGELERVLHRQRLEFRNPSFDAVLAEPRRGAHAASAPGGRSPTAASSACSAPSSRSAGSRPSPATWSQVPGPAPRPRALPRLYNHDRAHTGRLTKGAPPPRSSVPLRCGGSRRDVSPHLGVRTR